MRESRRLIEKKAAFRGEGAAARRAGRPLSSCPYAERSWSGELWREGWRGAA